MFDRNSRYSGIRNETLMRVGPDGRPQEIAYKARRPVPPAEAGATMTEHVVAERDRIDNLAARYLGDPLEFWRILDANRARHSDDLIAFDGTARAIRIALPEI